MPCIRGWRCTPPIATKSHHHPDERRPSRLSLLRLRPGPVPRWSNGTGSGEARRANGRVRGRGLFCGLRPGNDGPAHAIEAFAPVAVLEARHHHGLAAAAGGVDELVLSQIDADMRMGAAEGIEE